MNVSEPGFLGGDRTDIKLPARQHGLLEAVAATGKPIVLVLMSGSALAVNWADLHVDAIVQAWYPGEEGGAAIADVLFGDYNPAGRLPVTFYKSVEQLPPFENYAMDGRTYRFFTGQPLYPFGHGLSYTNFRYSSINISSARVKSTDKVTVSATVENAGDRAGDEVVQLYVRDVAASIARPVKELKGFQRITLQPGAKRSVEFVLRPEHLGFYNQEMRFVVEPGEFRVMVGSNSQDVIEKSFEVR